MAKIGQRRVAIFLLNGWQVRLVDVWRCALALEREHTFIIHKMITREIWNERKLFHIHMAFRIRYYVTLL